MPNLRNYTEPNQVKYTQRRHALMTLTKLVKETLGFFRIG